MITLALTKTGMAREENRSRLSALDKAQGGERQGQDAESVDGVGGENGCCHS
jgi:hypothetical protein